jgi:hypothetical protein
MPRHFPRFLFLVVVCLCGSALEGCSVIAMSATTLRPRPLTAAQSSLVDRAGSLGVVAVVDDPHAPPGRGLAFDLERTGLFRAIVPVGSGGPAPDYVATVRGQCYEPWAPVLPLLTLGVLPQFHWTRLGASFILRERATGQEVVIPCEIESLVGVGWIPLLMNVLPGWAPGKTEMRPSFGRRLAYGIVSRLHPPPPPQRSE